MDYKKYKICKSVKQEKAMFGQNDELYYGITAIQLVLIAHDPSDPVKDFDL
jgi:hypothetical protein